MVECGWTIETYATHNEAMRKVEQEKALKQTKRFWSKVVKTDTCWLWKAAINNTGYSIFWGNGKLGAAHRFAYKLLVGEIPVGYDLDHLCRVRHCVNPAHLEPVTRQENLLRGQTITASNAAKTHCPKGHAFIGNNIKMNSGSRKCRTCENAYTRQWRATQRLAYV